MNIWSNKIQTKPQAFLVARNHPFLHFWLLHRAHWNAFGNGSDLQIVAFKCYSLSKHSRNFAEYSVRYLESSISRCCAVIRCCRAPAEPGKIRCVVPSSLRSLILNNFHLATVSQVGRKFTPGVHPGETDNRHQVGMFPPRIRVSLQTAFPWVKNEGAKKKEDRATEQERARN